MKTAIVGYTGFVGSNICATTKFDAYYNSKNIEDLKNNLEKERDSLINSINRREKLLSNDNYVNKAPSNIVENERNTLEKEKNRLNDILVKLRNI